MNIIASCHMSAGTFQAKFIPLSKVERIKNIYVVRREKGPEIEKVKYLLLPKICSHKIPYLILTPFILAYYARMYKTKIIISYHFIPHGYFAYVASVLTGIPFNISQTGLYIQRYAEKPQWGKIILKIFRKAAFINVPGTKSRDFWVSKGIETKRVKLLHSTIDTDYFVSNTQLLPEYDIVYLGRFSEEKQIHLIINAIGKLLGEGIKLRAAIVGDGPLMQQMIKHAKKLGIDDLIDFPGFKTDTLKWLKKSRIFVMASQSEGLPCSLMEAMSCGMSVVVPAVGNIADVVINGKTGYLMPEASEENLYQKLKMALINYSDDDKIHEEARRIIVEEHSYHYVVRKWNEVLNEIYGNKL